MRDDNEVIVLRKALEKAEEDLGVIAYDLHNGMHPDDAAEHLAKACEKAREALATAQERAA